MTIESLSRSDLANVWAEGLLAAKAGKPRAANPYVGKNPELAKNWDQGYRSY